jgi:hypothetical protein
MQHSLWLRGPAFPNCAGNRDANGNPTRSENEIGEHSRYIVHYGSDSGTKFFSPPNNLISLMF